MHIPPPPPLLVPPPPARIRVACDTECYPNYWLCKMLRASDRQVIAEYEIYPTLGITLDRAAFASMLRAVTIVSFNGNSYDVPMIAAALQGYDERQLKTLSDAIIVGRMRPWDIERQFRIAAPDYLDHIDLFDILPGEHGLKMYMAKMHSKRIQELPIPPDTHITPELRALLLDYCGNDNSGVIDALELFAPQIKMREDMTREYGLDLRSKSDAQIAEAVILNELQRRGIYVERPVWLAGSWFQFDVPHFIEYQTPTLRAMLDRVRNAKFVLGEGAVMLPVELDADQTPAANIRIGHSVYTLGIGGLHSQEKTIFHKTDAHFELQDVDVESYYPRLMLNSGQYPPQMGEAFRTVFSHIVDSRIDAKNTVGRIKKEWNPAEREMPASVVVELRDAQAKTDNLKIVINGTFGKLLSKYGKLSAPKFGIQTTVSGQLSILMLIETLELAGISVVSANTDGIVIKCPRPLLWLRDQLVKAWETRTGLKTEAVVYDAIYFRDVNNYVAFKRPTEKDPNPKPKLKGAFAPSVPVGGSWPNPTGFVCVEAAVAYLKHGTPIEQTVRACRDIRNFVFVRNVKGGGVKYYGDEIEAQTTLGNQRAQLAAAGWVEVRPKEFDHPQHGTLPMKEAYKIALRQLRERNPIKKEYLGKVVRWYFAVNMPGAIRYHTNGNLVPKTEGAKPCMNLPDEFPTDIDYDWYIREAKSMIADLGVAMCE